MVKVGGKYGGHLVQINLISFWFSVVRLKGALPELSGS
jgi:hypothetical protein